MLSSGFIVGAIMLQSIIPVGYALTALIGIFISPDLDLDGNISDLIIRRKLGRVGQKMWRLFWKPYASLEHRSFLSHFPIVSTFIRLVYIWLWTLPFLYLWSILFINPNLMSSIVKCAKIVVFNPVLFIGLMSADILHFLMDKLIKERTK